MGPATVIGMYLLPEIVNRHQAQGKELIGPVVFHEQALGNYVWLKCRGFEDGREIIAQQRLESGFCLDMITHRKRASQRNVPDVFKLGRKPGIVDPFILFAGRGGAGGIVFESVKKKPSTCSSLA